MAICKYLERIRFIDSLIRKRATGNTEALSKKLNLSLSATEKIIHEMKEAGFPISYCKKRKSYFYNRDGKMVENLFIEEMDKGELRKITGGKVFFHLYTNRNYSTV